MKTVGTIVALATTVIAAFARKENLEHMPSIQVPLVILPLIGALLANFATEWRIIENYQLRENGRRSVQHLMNIGRAEYAAVTNAVERYTEIHRDLAERLDTIERDQSERFFVVAQPKERSEQIPASGDR